MSLTIECSELDHGKLFKKLLLQPDVLEYFPMFDMREIDDSVRVWEIFCKKQASLTAFFDGVACGLAYLNLQAYKKFAHQCLLTIIVDQDYRNKGIGTKLIEELCVMGKRDFHLEFLHLEVYETNPAIRLYERMGFSKFGYHKKFIKEKSRYIGKIFMQKSI